MESTFVNSQKDSLSEEDSSNSSANNGELSGKNNINYTFESNLLVSSARHSQISNVRKLHRNKSFIKSSLLRSTLGLGNKIPRNIVTLEEKYLRHCLEQIHISAAKTGRSMISEFSSEDMHGLSDAFNPVKVRSEDTSDFSRFVFGCPLEAAADGSVVIGLPGQWIVGSIMGSKSMLNIVKSPLMQKFGALDGDFDFGGKDFNSVKGLISYDYMSSPGGLSNFSSSTPEKETARPGDHRYLSGNHHRRLTSLSSTNSTSSDHSSSLSPSISQGMLQCSWKNGIPHFVFSLDSQREAYLATLSMNDSSLDKGMEYQYLFYSTIHGHGFHDKESHLIGKMTVSTSFTICPDSSKVKETQFVLFGDNENLIGEMQASNNKRRKNKGQLKKFANVFRTSHSSKPRSMSRFAGSRSIWEDDSLEPCQDAANSSDAFSRANLLEEPLPPHLQLAAILAKEHVPQKLQPEAGGWGLKFLKRAGTKPGIGTPESEGQNSFADRSGDCSTSMDVLLPAGFHGGPWTRSGGPSSLIERWRSGGHCDCGGWDLGCPLTVHKTRPSKDEASPDVDVSEACKSFGIFIQGSEHSPPSLRIASIHDGLYFVHFQSTLSVLQSFSIAVAYIHTRSPALQPKNVQ